jgi:hypothetical protein
MAAALLIFLGVDIFLEQCPCITCQQIIVPVKEGYTFAATGIVTVI